MKLPINTQWVIATVKEPVIFQQTLDEAWLLNPNRRYILNANRLETIEPFLDTVSEFECSSLYHRLHGKADLCGGKLLVERCRERGLGDLLFLTGVLGYLQHISSNNVQIDLMGFADRGVVLTHSPLISNGCVKCGPVEYDALRHYNYHWFVNSVTEQDTEQDQLNVYDALYQQLGFDYTQIEPRWKRPTAVLKQEDYLSLDAFFRRVMDGVKVDLRHIGYIVVAPFSNSNLRCLSYTQWLNVISLLATRRPVVVVGTATMRLPDTDISAGEFIQRLGQFGQAVVNAVDSTNTRALMALISRASAVVCLDSAPLYIAQALNTPAVSLWGTHHPAARIGYDQRYMEWAIWHGDACRCAPCFAYSYFPYDKCPKGRQQQVCEVMLDIDAQEVLNKVDEILATPTSLTSLTVPHHA